MSEHWSQLDPDAQFAARIIADTLTTPVRELGADVARKLLDTPPRDHSAFELTIPTRSGRRRARLYRPAESLNGVLMYLHGGGFVLGTLDGADAICRAIADRSGWAVLSLEYRLAPENPYPAALEDCFDAFDWLREEAPDRPIAVGGDSAGGNLATALCLKLRDFRLPQPVAQVLVYPAVDDTFRRPSWEEFADAPLLTSADARWFWEQYIADKPVDHLAAPMHAETLRGLPPTLVITAAVDPLRDDAEAYADRLQSDGVDVTTTRYDGVFHGFFTEVGVFAKTDQAINQVAQFLRQVLTADNSSTNTWSSDQVI